MDIHTIYNTNTMQYGTGGCGCKKDDWVRISSRVDNRGIHFGQVTDSTPATCTVKLNKRSHVFQRTDLKMLLDSSIQDEYNYPKFLADVAKIIATGSSEVPIPQKRPAGLKVEKTPITATDKEDFKKAIDKNNIEMVRLLIKKGINVNERIEVYNGKNYFTFACEKGNVDIVNLLINSGAIINYKTLDNTTPLMIAAAYNNFEVVRLLIEKGADINITNDTDVTVISLAYKNKNVNMIELLIQKGVEVNLEILYLVFIDSCINNKVERVKELLKNPEIKKYINKFDGDKKTPLMYACEHQRIEMVNLLITEGADVNVTSTQISPLIIAINKKNKEIIRILIQNKVNVEFKDNKGNTSLMIAIIFKLYEIINILIDEGKAIVDISTIKLIIEKGYIIIFLLLVEKGIHLDDSNYNEVLINACRNNNLDGFDDFINNPKVNLNYQDQNGMTCLMYLIQFNLSIDKIKLLLTKEIDINAFDKSGDTVLHHAINTKNVNIIKILCDIDNIDVLKKNNRGQSGFSYTFYQSYTILPELKKLMKRKEYDTAFLDSCRYANYKYFDELMSIQPPINFNYQDENKENCLMHLIKRNENKNKIKELLKELLKKNININLVNKDGNTALHLAIALSNTEIIEEIIKNPNIDNLNDLFINLCKNNYFHNLESLLEKPNLFIDIYDDRGMTSLMWAVIYGKLMKIPKLLAKGINVNAIDINGDTALHHAIKIDHVESIIELCKSKEIIPIIPNNTGYTALQLSIGKRYHDIIKGTMGTGLKVILNQKWKGVTKFFIENLFSQYIAIKGDVFLDPQNTVPCLACLKPINRIDACNHLRHSCKNYYDLSPNIGHSGLPYSNDNLRRAYDICHTCCVCGCEYPHLERSEMCSFEVKYYRMYKIIEKFIKLQPAIGTISELTYKEAMDQITSYGASITLGKINPEELSAVIKYITKERTILPPTYDRTKFPNVTMETLYPPIGEIEKKIPNMRKTKDVIENNLMPNIILYDEIKLGDGSSYNPKQFRSPDDRQNLESFEKGIKFRHREFKLPNNIKEHEDFSLDSFLVLFNTDVSEKKNEIYFGKCVLNKDVYPDKCVSYLYPDELKILVINGYISHEKYITYRNNFSKSDKINIEYSPIAHNYFLPEPSAPAPPAPAPVNGAGNFNIMEYQFKEKYLKYKLKYLALKKEQNLIQFGGDYKLGDWINHKDARFERLSFPFGKIVEILPNDYSVQLGTKKVKENKDDKFYILKPNIGLIPKNKAKMLLNNDIVDEYTNFETIVEAWIKNHDGKPYPSPVRKPVSLFINKPKVKLPKVPVVVSIAAQRQPKKLTEEGRRQQAIEYAMREGDDLFNSADQAELERRQDKLYDKMMRKQFDEEQRLKEEKKALAKVGRNESNGDFNFSTPKKAESVESKDLRSFKYMEWKAQKEIEWKARRDYLMSRSYAASSGLPFDDDDFDEYLRKYEEEMRRMREEFAARSRERERAKSSFTSESNSSINIEKELEKAREEAEDNATIETFEDEKKQLARMILSGHTWVDIFGIPSNSERKEKRLRYFYLAQIFHPDKCLGHERICTKIFQKIQKAKEEAGI